MKTINNKQYEECSLVMLATDEESNIEKYEGSLYDEYLVLDRIPSKGRGNGVFKNQHLYILSDEVINKGELYYLLPEKQIKQAQKNLPVHRDWKKIIATTDKSLKVSIKGITTPEGVYVSTHDRILPQIPQSFIEHYIEQYNDGNVIDKVLVEYLLNETGNYREFDSTPELKHKLKINSDNTINILTQKDSWNRDEVVELIWEYKNAVNKDKFINTDEWISKNL